MTKNFLVKSEDRFSAIPFAITFNGAQAIRFTRNSQRRLSQKEQIDLALEQSVVDNELARLQQQQILAREMAKAKELIPDYTEREATRRVSIRYGILSENGHKAARPTERP